MADIWQLSDYTLTESSCLTTACRAPTSLGNSLSGAGSPRVSMRRPSASSTTRCLCQWPDTTPGGSRLDLKPFVSMPLQGASWYITPTLAWRYTSYKLDEEFAADPALHGYQPFAQPADCLARCRPVFRSRHRDQGRALSAYAGTTAVLSECPVPRPDGLPIFDTRPLTFSWGQLFRDNRYSGPDRQTDANQLTLALTSRLLRQADGHEKLAASLGQIFYFDESRVTAPGEVPVESGKSAWVADVNYAPTDRWTIGASYQWNPKFRREDLASLRARYLLPDDGVINLGYRYRRNVSNGADLLEQADFSFLYPITPTWSVVGRYYYSILDKKPLEALAGVQWDSCCLAVRAGRAALRAQSRRRPEQSLPGRVRTQGSRLGRSEHGAHLAPCYSRLLPRRPLSRPAKQHYAGPRRQRFRTGMNPMKTMTIRLLLAGVLCRADGVHSRGRPEPATAGPHRRRGQ